MFGNFNLRISPFAVWITLAIVFVAFLIISLILTYHWIRFGVNPKKMTAITIVYLVGGIILILVMFASAAYYQISA